MCRRRKRGRKRESEGIFQKYLCDDVMDENLGCDCKSLGSICL